VLQSLRNGGPNAEDRAARTAGYYQGLLDGGNAALSTGFLAHRIDLSRDQAGIGAAWKSRWTGDFLWYELPPDLDTPSRAGHLKTSSQGLADREYALAHPARTWRIALLGDSIVRGWGTNPGETFEARLEERLNAAHLPPGVDAIEVLNFGVDGYRLTQVRECALTKAVRWEPDVYVVSLGPLAGPQMWTAHLAGLVREGRDLKYDTLRRIAEEAGLDRYDPPATTRAKLAPYHAEVLRWCLVGLRDHAAGAGKELLFLLTPTVEPPADLADDFAGVPEMLDELALRYVDLRDAFAGHPDPAALRISSSDTHPTGPGHAILFEKLLARILADPELLRTWTGG
jgi:lysophospholipase L1-like esterase